MVTKIKNLIYYYFFKFLKFLIYDKVSYSWLKLSEKDQNNLSHKIYSSKKDHLFIGYEYLRRLGSKDPLLFSKKIFNYSKLRKKWISNNNYYEEEDYIPDQQVMGSLGNYNSLFYYLFYRLNIEKNNKKPLILLKEKERITNEVLLNYFKPFLKIEYNTYKFYKKKFIKEVNKIPIEICLPYKNNYYLTNYAINFYRQDAKLNLKFNYFKMSKYDIKEGWKKLKKFGINKNNWFVVLHIRDTDDTHNFRNSNPLSYVEAIKCIISNGGYVIRIGRNERTKLPKIKGLIDYPFSDIKSDFMDIFLTANCKFFMGTSSGPAAVSQYFNKPLLLVNCLPVAGYFELKKQDMFLPKILRDKNSKKVINLKRYFNLPINNYLEDNAFKKNKIMITDNSVNELKLSALEMINKCFEKKNNSLIQKNLAFKKQLKKNFLNHFNKPLKYCGDFPSVFINYFD